MRHPTRRVTFEEAKTAFADIGAELSRVGDMAFLEGDTDSPSKDTIRIDPIQEEPDWSLPRDPENFDVALLLLNVIRARDAFDSDFYYENYWGLSPKEGHRDYPEEAPAAKRLLDEWASLAERLLYG